MKKIWFVLLAISLFVVSCNNPRFKNTPVSHGNPGEIIVVMENGSWNSEPGDTMRAIFHQDCPNLPMEENIFDLYQIPRAKFVEQNMLHRNIIFQEINPDVKEAKITITRDKYAQKQVFVNVVAPNQKAFVEIMSKNKQGLIKLFYESDRNRWVDQIVTHSSEKVSNALLKDYSISLSVPQNYFLDEARKDFAWISFEGNSYSMGILVYEYPLTDSTRFELEYLIARRNEVLQKNVPGERDGSYMTTETKYDYPTLEIQSHKNMETAVMHGLWKVHGDFMGGPFVSYTKIDRPRNRVVTVEGFVYHPNEEVRDQIRQLDGVLYTFDLVK
jgi:hypothetical protein